jgi:hypothetical protein
VSYTSKQLLAVQAALPVESGQALATFVTANPHWRGAQWADVLDVLADSDSNLEVTEPMWDGLEAAGALTEARRPYITLVTLTLLYAHPGEPEHPSEAEVLTAIDMVLASATVTGSEP